MTVFSFVMSNVSRRVQQPQFFCETMPKVDEWVKLTIEAENEERKRKLTYNSIGLLENHPGSAKLSNPIMVSANMRGKWFMLASTWSRMCRILELQLPEDEIRRN